MTSVSGDLQTCVKDIFIELKGTYIYVSDLQNFVGVLTDDYSHVLFFTLLQMKHRQWIAQNL